MIEFNGSTCEIKQYIETSKVESLPEYINTPAKSSIELIRKDNFPPVYFRKSGAYIRQICLELIEDVLAVNL
jgi:hypothetical protein